MEEHFATIANDTVVAKLSILDVYRSAGYASDNPFVKTGNLENNWYIH